MTLKEFLNYALIEKDDFDITVYEVLIRALSRIFRVEFIKSEIRYKIDAAFRAEGVHIPFPQRDVHIRSQPPGKE